MGILKLEPGVIFSLVNPMGSCTESKICRYHGDSQIGTIYDIILSKFNRKLSEIQNMQISCGFSIFEISMCHNLSSDHFGDKSLKNVRKVCHKIDFSQKNYFARGGIFIENQKRENIIRILEFCCVQDTWLYFP